MVSPPKIKAGNRSIILPVPVLAVLKKYREIVTSKWMFPSPVNENSPRDPAAVRKRLHTVLERADCKKIRFHDLRCTFVSALLEHGMDIKTLFIIIGHVSSSTTLNIYAHITDEMRRTAAVKIRVSAKPIRRRKSKQHLGNLPQHFPGPQGPAAQGRARAVLPRSTKNPGKAATLLSGWTEKHPRNIYAHSEEECETLLAKMIVEMRTEITAEKEWMRAAAKTGQAERRTGV